MSSLNKNQWVAVSVALVVIIAFIYFFTPLFMNPTNNATSTNTSKVAVKGSMVTVNYTGKFANGQVFDTSVNQKPIQFQLGVGQVIQGWDEGLIGMKPGDKKHLVIPPEKAYGSQAYPPGDHPVIPANSTLYFDVEMVDVQN